MLRLLPIVLALSGCTYDRLESVKSIDRSPETCNLSSIAGSSLHQKHLRFAKLLALSLGQTTALRQAIKDASFTNGQDFFNEILIHDFLPQSVGNTTVNAVLAQKFESTPSLAEGQTFSAFKTELLAADPLLVIKIPDWFFDTTWNVQTMPPCVVSNIKGAGQYLYGFDVHGNCFSKESYFEAFIYEIVVKTSEDYLWVNGVEFLEGFAHPCMSYQSFFDTYARPYYGHYLIKKRDMQRLVFSCMPDTPDGPLNPPPVNCKRDAGFDRNYMMGFQLAYGNIILTLQNQPCLGGEETLDFQIDYLYAFRTAEDAAIDAKLPPIPLYGLRWRDLVNIKFRWWLANGIVRTPKYYAINIGAMKYDYMKHINPVDQEWNPVKTGEALYVAWNETDFQICNGTQVQTVNNTVGATLNFSLPFEWKPGGTFNSAYSKISSHTVAVVGAAVVPLGYNALGYCDVQPPGAPPSIWYPTGPQGLLVHYNYVLD